MRTSGALPGGRDRRAVTVVTGLVLVAVVLAVAGAVLLFGSGGSTPAADAEQTHGIGSVPSSASSGDSARASAGAPAGDGKADLRHRPRDLRSPVRDAKVFVEAAAAYVCWDGDAVAHRRDCTDPSGVLGMNWVFPRTRSGACSQQEPGDRVQAVSCVVTAASGRAVRVDYAEWAVRTDGVRRFSREARRHTTWRGMGRWDLAGGRGPERRRTALMYARAPWSVTVSARRAADRDEVLGRLVWRRPVHLRGHGVR
ncbi:MAG TPA: hypothetical protein VNS55_12480 [Nocardioides sp.]|nr:hypothetical protein [Nocardioides sp.]